MSDEKLLPMRQENLKIIYEEVCNSVRAIDDFRAKLLSFLPLVSGAGIFLVLSDAFTDPTKRSFASQFMIPIGIFGFVVTLGLFFYELRGIQRCNNLIEIGKQTEEALGVAGQFTYYPGRISGIISNTIAACIIYSIVLTAWVFVAFIFVGARVTFVVTPFVFFISLTVSCRLNLKMRLNQKSDIDKY